MQLALHAALVKEQSDQIFLIFKCLNHLETKIALNSMKKVENSSLLHHKYSLSA